jgi:hypothetical protein
VSQHKKVPIDACIFCMLGLLGAGIVATIVIAVGA